MEIMNQITIKKGQTPSGSSIFVDFDGNKWVIFSVYNHLGSNYVQALRIPKEVETFKIVER